MIWGGGGHILPKLSHKFEKMTSLYIELMMLHVPQMVMFVAGITTITSTAEV